jgi:hypothetical protein
MESLLHTNPVLDYATSNWGHHARGEAEETSMVLILQFLRKEPNVACASQVLLCRGPWFFDSARQISGMHLLSLFGFQKAMCCYLKSGC